ncbi:hypothetical protein Pmani_035803 [Petrolisthes manimaculis]|uniref:Uncharacterized protein n=1 Tax=Petrolisthes manimaculis TaxID=1843537 RepID=A0AAE1TQ30_9EUCA|nr:hypothetical protein Pmani_035803 [Petrolisthes manimaculis]
MFTFTQECRIKTLQVGKMERGLDGGLTFPPPCTNKLIPLHRIRRRGYGYRGCLGGIGPPSTASHYLKIRSESLCSMKTGLGRIEEQTHITPSLYRAHLVISLAAVCIVSLALNATTAREFNHYSIPFNGGLSLAHDNTCHFLEFGSMDFFRV